MKIRDRHRYSILIIASSLIIFNIYGQPAGREVQNFNFKLRHLMWSAITTRNTGMHLIIRNIPGEFSMEVKTE